MPEKVCHYYELISFVLADKTIIDYFTLAARNFRASL